MRIAKKYRDDLTDRFENEMDFMSRFDPIPFFRKREAAEVAARAAVEYLENNPK